MYYIKNGTHYFCGKYIVQRETFAIWGSIENARKWKSAKTSFDVLLKYADEGKIKKQSQLKDLSNFFFVDGNGIVSSMSTNMFPVFTETCIRIGNFYATEEEVTKQEIDRWIDFYNNNKGVKSQ